MVVTPNDKISLVCKFREEVGRDDGLWCGNVWWRVERKRKRESGGREINRGNDCPSGFAIPVLWCATARPLLTTVLTLKLAVGRHQR